MQRVWRCNLAQVRDEISAESWRATASLPTLQRKRPRRRAVHLQTGNTQTAEFFQSEQDLRASAPDQRSLDRERNADHAASRIGKQRYLFQLLCDSLQFRNPRWRGVQCPKRLDTSASTL